MGRQSDAIIARLRQQRQRRRQRAIRELDRKLARHGVEQVQPDPFDWDEPFEVEAHTPGNTTQRSPHRTMITGHSSLKVTAPGGHLSANTSGSSIPIGLNTVPVGMGTRFGDDVEEGVSGISLQQVEDFQSLGATILRQVGAYDLTWKNLAGESVGIPRLSNPRSADQELIRRFINTEENRRKWADFFSLLDEHGCTVVLTCFAYGERLVSSEPDQLKASGNIGVVEPLLLNWSKDHDPADVSELYTVLDIRQAYEVAYLGHLARGIAALLAGVADTLGSDGHSILSRVIVGLEVFSAVEAFNVSYDAAAEKPLEGDAIQSAASWGSVFATLASTLRRELDGYGLDLPLHLPGISSFYETVNLYGTPTRNSWTYRQQFLTHFLKSINRELSGGPYTLADLAKGLNYEWSHRSEKTTSGAIRVGPRHICTMQDDLDDIRDILDRFHLDIPITILQTGMSATDADEGVPDWASSQEWMQAYEVYRRLGGALAAGAEAVGWESWMSIYTARQEDGGREGTGMGLREDTATTTAASRALPRESWSAYQRFTSFFSTIRSAHFLTDEDSALVLIAGQTGRGYLYLAFIDSTETGSSRYQLTARQTAGRRLATSVNQHATLADWAQITYNTDRAVLRAIEPIYSEAEALSWSDGSLSLTFSPGQAPILLTSTAALLWTVQREVPVEIEHPQEWAIYL